MATNSLAQAPVAEHATGGLPQFDFSWWAGEATWMAIVFVVLFVLFRYVFVPRIGGTINEREDKISGDIGGARRLKEEAQAEADAAAGELAQARARAHKLATDAKAAAAAESAERGAVEEAKLAAVLAESEGRINAARTEAMSHVRAIATEIAGVMVAKLTGSDASAAEIDRAVPGQA